jgi:hypothetical protein
MLATPFMNYFPPNENSRSQGQDYVLKYNTTWIKKRVLFGVLCDETLIFFTLLLSKFLMSTFNPPYIPFKF